jgi:hypothetical protein
MVRTERRQLRMHRTDEQVPVLHLPDAKIAGAASKGTSHKCPNTNLLLQRKGLSFLFGQSSSCKPRAQIG